jgi:nucleoside 2-deoxyribosyltransferase
VKIYIAGKWEELHLIDEYAKRLEAIGHTITLPWFRTHLGKVEFSIAAAEDVKGVGDADTCIFIFERMLPYKGAFVELGIAIALKKRIILVGSGGDGCIFTHLTSIERVPTFDACLEAL